MKYIYAIYKVEEHYKKFTNRQGKVKPLTDFETGNKA